MDNQELSQAELDALFIDAHNDRRFKQLEETNRKLKDLLNVKEKKNE